LHQTRPFVKKDDDLPKTPGEGETRAIIHQDPVQLEKTMAAPSTRKAPAGQKMSPFLTYFDNFS